MESPSVVELEHGRAVAVRVEHAHDLAPAVAALELGAPRPTLVVVGGAAGLDDGAPAGLELLAGGVVRAAAACGAVIVDGGTDAGVMRLVGLARATTAPRFRSSASSCERSRPCRACRLSSRCAELEPHHTHFILVPGSSWGEEAPWIASCRGAIAGEPPVGDRARERRRDRVDGRQREPRGRTAECWPSPGPAEPPMGLRPRRQVNRVTSARRRSSGPGSSRRSAAGDAAVRRLSVGSSTSLPARNPRMPTDSSSSWPVQEFGGLIDEFELDDRQKRFLQARWLDQMAWFDRKAKQAQRRYYLLRLVAIVGGLVVPGSRQPERPPRAGRISGRLDDLRAQPHRRDLGRGRRLLQLRRPVAAVPPECRASEGPRLAVLRARRRLQRLPHAPRCLRPVRRSCRVADRRGRRCLPQQGDATSSRKPKRRSRRTTASAAPEPKPEE